MGKLLRLVFSRWTLLAVLLAALSLAIWWGGPTVAIAGRWPLESEAARWATIAALFALVLLRVAFGAWQARRGNAAVVDRLIAAPPQSAAPAESADLAAVRERFESALKLLRRTRFAGGGRIADGFARWRGRYLYELPWYLIIGAPGSGKTTALRHSGLRFPLAEAMGDHAVKGVGGTRHCDWWFTDSAVLIDTAGRFVTQDSDRETDRGTWNGFLALLKRSRPRQPINGVLVTVSASDLLTRSPAERAEHAATVRQRLQELHEGLAIRFPIYLLVTKCDLMAGFMDYFATLDKEQRAAGWGFTYDDPDGGHDPVRLAAGLDALLQRLNDGLVDRLQAERDLRRRASIYGFPSQFAGLKPLLGEFVDAVFSPSPFEARPRLRGVYFVSGTQEGTPIDRLLGAIARSYRLERAILAPNQASGRSYFLQRLLGEVVFAESGLAGTDRTWERRRAALVAGGYAGVALVTGLVLTAWGVSWFHNRAYVDEVARREDDVRRQVLATPNRATSDLQPVLPALEATRRLAQPEGGVPWSLGFGLSQRDKLDGAARRAYERMLVDAVQPRLALRIEEQLRQGGEMAESRYEALKAYVMLHDVAHFDAAALEAWFRRDWEAQAGRGLAAEDVERLGAHLQALFDQGGIASPIPRDDALVADVRARLTRVPLAQRIYERMRQQGLGAGFPEFTAVRAGGSNVPLVFVRASGQPLTKGVPGLFSVDGYQKEFQAKVGEASRQLAAEEPWVLAVAPAPADPRTAVAPGGPADAVREIYLNEYRTAWLDFVADLRLRPSTTIDETVQLARLVAQPDGPLPLVLKAIAKQTTLARGDGLIDRAQSTARQAIETAVSGALGRKPPAEAALEKRLVDDHFATLRNLITAPEGGKPPLDDTLALVGELYVHLNAVQDALRANVSPPPSPVPTRVKAAAGQMPEPLRAMLEKLGNDGGRISVLTRREQLGREVKAQIGEFCQLALANRYPLDRRAAQDTPAADFARLFSPGGAFDKLVQGPLAPVIDTSTKPWSFRVVDGISLGSDVGTLPQFQRAQAIRDAFFGAGGVVALKLDFKPVDMDPSLTQFILDVDGQIVRYAHGPQISTPVSWPGPGGRSEVRVQISPPGAGASGMVETGPWALLRIFDRVRIDPGPSPERFRATFDLDGRKAVFEVTTSSVRNPFKLAELSQFSCPMGL